MQKQSEMTHHITLNQSDALLTSDHITNSNSQPNTQLSNIRQRAKIKVRNKGIKHHAPTYIKYDYVP